MNNTEKQALVDWNSLSLGELTLSSDYGTSKKTNDHTGIPVLRMGNMKDGRIVLDNLVFLELDNSEFQRLKLYPGDILINRTNSADLVGKVSIFDLDGDYVCASYIVRFKINQEIINPYYLNYYMNMSDSQNRIKTIATQAIQQANINPTTLKKSFIVKFPKSKHEQDKIVTIISTWDKAIELKEKLIEEKNKQKTGLMQKLLTGKVRLPGFKGEWKEVKLGKVLKDKTEKTTENDQYQILSCTKDGIVSQSDHFNKQIASTNNIGYKILKKGEVVLSPMNLWLGGIDISTFDVGIVSPAYKVYEVDYSIIGENYLRNLLRSDYMIAKYDSISQKGASVVRRNLSIKEFESLTIKLPTDFNEMNAIDKLIGIASKEIALLEAELKNLKLQRKGLMQLLLTGIIRVNTQENEKR